MTYRDTIAFSFEDSEFWTEAKCATILTVRILRFLVPLCALAMIASKPPRVQFEDASASSGLNFVLNHNPTARKYLVEKWMRDAKINDIFEGTQQINMIIIARRVLGYSSKELN